MKTQKIKRMISVLLAAALCIAMLPCTASAGKSLSSQSASRFVENLTVGWNLGNTLDAVDGSGLKTETSWGNPKASQKLITAVKKAGFNTVRIPISWGKHIDDEGLIDDAWLYRVQEVIDYAYDSGMFVIIDMHNDDGWMKFDKKSFKNASDKFYVVWWQIARRFKNYDEHLIFDAISSPGEFTDSDADLKTQLKNINQLYADFVYLIRNSGGCNDTRFLMLAPFCAYADYATMSALELPDDDKLIVSIHSYEPNSIAINPDLKMKKFTQFGKECISDVFKNINKAFISKGIPVIMSEFGFINKNNADECAKAAKYFIRKANSYGIPCCWWDNGVTKASKNGESFGLIDRRTLKWTRSKVSKAVVSAAKGE